jgi:preprotein translocase subunit SecG
MSRHTYNNGQGRMPTTAKGMLWPLLLLNLATLACALVGLALLQHRCGDDSNSSGAGSYATQFAVGAQLPYGTNACSHIWRYIWWILAFDFFVWAGIVLTLLTRMITNLRLAWLAMLAIAAALTMWAANVALNVIDTTYAGDNKWAKVLFAGMLATAALQLLKIFLMGWEVHPHHDVAYGAAPAGAYTAPVAGAYKPTGPVTAENVAGVGVGAGREPLATHTHVPMGTGPAMV